MVEKQEYDQPIFLRETLEEGLFCLPQAYTGQKNTGTMTEAKAEIGVCSLENMEYSVRAVRIGTGSAEKSHRTACGQRQVQLALESDR